MISSCCSRHQEGKFSLKTDDIAVVPYSQSQIVRFRDDAFALAKCTVLVVSKTKEEVPLDSKGCRFFEVERLSAEIACDNPPLNIIVNMAMPGTVEQLNQPTYRGKLAVSINGLLYGFPSPYGTCSDSNTECFSEITIAGRTYQDVILKKIMVPVADSVKESRLYYNASHGVIRISFPSGEEYTLE